MNTFYSLNIVKPTDLTEGQYTIWNNVLYQKQYGKIHIVEVDDFLYYDLDKKCLYRVSCRKTETYTATGLLFDMTTNSWVSFKTLTDTCNSSCCKSVIDQIVCTCSASSEIPCYENVAIGFDNQVSGLANRVNGNECNVSGMFSHLNGYFNLSPSLPITVDNITFNAGDVPNTYVVRIPGNYLSACIGHTYLLLQYYDRYYWMIIISPMPSFDGDNTIITLRQSFECNDIPPFGVIPSVIPTTNNSVDITGNSNINFSSITVLQDVNFPITDLRINQGYNSIIGEGNLISGGSFSHIDGQLNMLSLDYTFTVANGITDLSTIFITTQNKPFNIAYVNGTTAQTGTTTLTRVGAQILSDGLPNGVYAFLPIDAIRFTVGIVPNTVVPEAFFPPLNLSGQRLLRYVSVKLDNQTDNIDAVLATGTANNQFLYPYSGNPDYDSVPAITSPGYLRYVFDRNLIQGVLNGVVGHNNNVYGILNQVYSDSSTVSGDFNLITGGNSNSILGNENTLNTTKTQSVVVFGNTNSYSPAQLGLNTFIHDDDITNHNLIVGNAISFDGSYNLTIGQTSRNNTSYSIQLSDQTHSKYSTFGYIDDQNVDVLELDTAVITRYINGVPYNNLTTGCNFIRLTPSAVISNQGIATDTGINVVKFNNSYSFQNVVIGVNPPQDFDNLLPLIPNRVYTLSVQSSFSVVGITNTNTFRKYTAPNYEIRFEVDANGLILTSVDRLYSNGVVFLEGSVNVSTLSSTPDTDPLGSELFMWVDQPVAGFFRLSYGVLGSINTTNSITATVSVDIETNQIRITPP